MRNAFIKTLVEFAKTNKSIFLITADLGFKLFDDFRKKYPDRFINVGVAEANMIGVAAGLALSDKKVFCYSMVPFLTMRALEQIRIDLCYQNLNVTLIGVGGGFWYGDEGVTHHAIEDISIMRSLPNMSVICPGDPWEAQKAIEASLHYRGPLYIRLAGNNDKIVHKKKCPFNVGRSIVITRNSDKTIFATGSMLHVANDVVAKLKSKGVEVNLISTHTIKPLDKQRILKFARKSRMIFTVEEHSVIGGLGSSVAEVLLEQGYRGYFRKIALPDRYSSDRGGVDYLRYKNGLDSESLFNLIIKEIDGMKGKRS